MEKWYELKGSILRVVETGKPVVKSWENLFNFLDSEGIEYGDGMVLFIKIGKLTKEQMVAISYFDGLEIQVESAGDDFVISLLEDCVDGVNGVVSVLNQRGDYTLLKRQSPCEPYVVAWKFDRKRGDWCQGHYFPDKFSAECFFNDRAIDFAW